jgi:beta-ureidopropionase / N-carbamoyl-L-amino-acid hydrolase
VRDREVTRTSSDPTAVARTFDRLWAELAPVGRDPASGGYRRFAYEPAELELREWFPARPPHAAWTSTRTAPATSGPGGATPTARRRAGHRQPPRLGAPRWGVRRAARGRVRVRRGRPAAGPRGRAGRPVAVVAFADEEGGRFGVACAGSRLLTGQLDPDRALGADRRRRGDPGGGAADVRPRPRRARRRPEVLASSARSSSCTSSRAAGWPTSTRPGRGRVRDPRPRPVALRPRRPARPRRDHPAGRPRRPDAAARQVVLAARAAAERCGGLATVGKVRVDPNGVNAIPARVTSWLDARADDEATVRAMVDEVADAAGTAPVEESWTPRVDLDAALRDRLAARLGRGPGPADRGRPRRRDPRDGRGPDGDAVRPQPHRDLARPEEHAERDDCLAGIDALADVLEDLAGRSRSVTTYVCELAWLPDGTTPPTSSSRCADGRFTRVEPGGVAPAGRRTAPGLVLPGSRRRPQPRLPPGAAGPHPPGRGTFWTWRELMYEVAERLTPDATCRWPAPRSRRRRWRARPRSASSTTSTTARRHALRRPERDRPRAGAGRAGGGGPPDAARHLLPRRRDRAAARPGSSAASATVTPPPGRPGRGPPPRLRDRGRRRGRRRRPLGPAVPPTQLPVVAAWARSHDAPCTSTSPSSRPRTTPARGLRPTPTRCSRTRTRSGPRTTAVHATHLTDGTWSCSGLADHGVPVPDHRTGPRRRRRAGTRAARRRRAAVVRRRQPGDRRAVRGGPRRRARPAAGDRRARATSRSPSSAAR